MQAAAAELATQLGEAIHEHAQRQAARLEPMPLEPPTPEEYVAELQRLDRLHGGVQMQLSFLQLMTVIGAVQLALRHPDFPANSQQMLNDWINDVAAALPSSILLRLIVAGFDPTFDQEFPR